MFEEENVVLHVEPFLHCILNPAPDGFMIERIFNALVHRASAEGFVDDAGSFASLKFMASRRTALAELPHFQNPDSESVVAVFNFQHRRLYFV